MQRFHAFVCLVLGMMPVLARADLNLVPTGPNLFPDYFCTWNVQGYACSYGSNDSQRRALVEANLFGHGPYQDWVDFYPAVRSGLFLVLDDSWDVPLNGDKRYFGSLKLNGERFPSFTGTPAERLKKLTDAVKAKGWRGLGGWVCAQQAPAEAVPDDDAYWTRRLGWMHDAGFSYLKVDWGDKCRDAGWRQHLTALAAGRAPGLIVEHALAEGALKSAAVYRTYDVENVIAAPVTIGRIAHLLKAAPKGSPTIINCEDEPYIAAGAGAAVGIMRHPFVGAMPNGRQDFVFPPVGRDLKRRMDEVIRCVNWHRIASPVPLSGTGDRVDPISLSDEWTLGRDETYTGYREGDRRDGRAPARLARGGLPLPIVELESEQLAPYVLACRSPNGMIAIASIGRTQGRRYSTPKASVTQEVGAATTIGVFGVFGKLTLRLAEPVGAGHVLAQDLAGSSSVDITSKIHIDGRDMVLPGELISEVGLSAGHPSDLSEPGLVVVIQK